MVSELTRSQDRRRRKAHKEKRNIRWIVQLLCVLAWAGFLFTFILVDNFEAYLYHRAVQFQWVSNPNFLKLLYLGDAHITSPNWLFVKLGHFTGFAIFDLLLWNLTKSKRISIIVSVSIAISSEILQLFFSRDGRVYDMVIDSLGVCAAYLTIKLMNKGRN